MNKTIYFSDLKLWAELEDYCNVRGVSMSSIIVEAVAMYLHEPKNCPTCEKVRQLVK